LVTVDQLKSIQSNVQAVATKLGLLTEVLTDDELGKFADSFERQFILAYPEREIVDIYMRHLPEILMGGMIAKKQMSAEIDGEQPAAGKVGGPIPIRACYMGIGDDWEDGGASITTGSPQRWIHSGTTLMGGTVGNAIKIGENQVVVIVGYISRHPSPKLESAKFTIDGKPKPILILAQSKLPDSLHIKEFNNAYIGKHDTTLYAEIFASATHGTTVTDIPELLGASFIKEDQLRVHDAASVPGTTPDVVLTT